MVKITYKRKKLLYIIYEVGMSVLAVIVLIILVIELTSDINDFYLNLFATIDFSILIIFAVDYAIRFFFAKKKFIFFKSNILDLVAIMPFDKVFRIARLARLTRLVRLSRTTKFARIFKLARLSFVLKRFGKGILKLLKTNGLNYVMLFTIILIFGGAYGILLFEKPYGSINSFGDALWWSLVTTTTVGYGDLSPVSTRGRFLAGILMIVGIGFIGMLTGSIATYFIKPSKEENSKSESCEMSSVIDISKLNANNKENIKNYVKFLEENQEGK